ncbi:Ycf66 family protein [Okeania sp.]|uniref:Ycf66 family protein n=1 Tax=Okeania sp. TaxID=3100323 RepID=UPI002B4AC1EE|nr:Ycf66 family protein [Okeania sp.]MEB3342755.1 Ycf66 family protein [Okeania sp.]
MLTNILALAVGFGSLALYMVAFFFPEVHRKNDFIWSGVGLFYALVLWFCAARITGALLLGQVAGVALLGWFAWESITLRRQVTPVVEQTQISSQNISEDNTQEKSTTISEETSTSNLIESTEISTEDLEQNISTEELVNEVKLGESESELLSPEITSDLSNMTKESEADRTESMIEENVLTDTQSVSEISEGLQTGSSKKAGGFSQLLTPVSGILSNIKNAIQSKGSKKTVPELTSTEIQSDTEKLSSNEEVNETGKEESVISDVWLEKTNLTEPEKETISSLDAESISTEKSISETPVSTKFSEVQDDLLSTGKIITKDTDNGEEKV